MKKYIEILYKNFIVFLVGIACFFIMALLLQVAVPKPNIGSSIALGLFFGMIFVIMPVISIIIGLLAQWLLKSVWYSVFNIMLIWLILYIMMSKQLIFIMFLPIYLLCGVIGSKCFLYYISKKNHHV